MDRAKRKLSSSTTALPASSPMSQKALIIEPTESDSGLHVIHVRMTDSFIAALEKCAVLDDSSIEIKCDTETCGRFIFSSNTSKDNNKEFSFNCKQVSQKQETHQNLLCIKNSNISKNFDLGELTTFLNIHANNEVFVSTKEKLEAIEVNKNKSKAKEFHPNFNKKSQNNNNSMINLRSVKNIIKKSSNQQTTRQIDITRNSSDAQNYNKSKLTKNVTDTNLRNNASSNIKDATNFMDYSIKKRILHIFGIRPHSMNDLLNRLLKEGMSNTDKSSIKDILNKLVDNYDCNKTSDTDLMHLKPGYFKHIDLMWPLYNKTELQLVKRNIDLNGVSSKQISLNSTNNSYNSSNESENAPKLSKIDDSQQHLQKKDATNSGLDVSKNKSKKVSNVSENANAYLNENMNETPCKGHKEIDKNDENLILNANILSKYDYTNFLREYNEIFPGYKELYDNVMITREKFKSYHRKLKNINVNEVENPELFNLKRKIDDEHNNISESFQHDVVKLRNLHSRVTHLSRLLKNHMNSQIQSS